MPRRNPLKVDPTRTAPIRRLMQAELANRFDQLKADVLTFLPVAVENSRGEDTNFDQITYDLALNILENEPTFADLVTNRSYTRDRLGRFAATAGHAVVSGVVPAIISAGAKIGHVEHAAKEWVKDGIAHSVSKLPPPLQKAVTATYYAGRAGTSVAFATWTAGQALAERVSREKGATPEEARRLKGILASMDVATMKPVQLGLHATGMGVTGLGIASMVPPATAGYLLYSTARNPRATYRAAKGLVRDAAKSASESAKSIKTTLGSRVMGWFGKKSKPSTPIASIPVSNAAIDNAALIAELIFDQNSRVEGSPNNIYDTDKLDWRCAVFAAALQETQDGASALVLANRVLSANPSPPKELIGNSEEKSQGANCGIGSGGFQKGNTCAKGNSGGSRETIGKGNTGDVYREGDIVIKSAKFKDGRDSQEGKIYEELQGMVGIAPGKRVGDEIHLPHYQEILSIDAVPSKRDRESMGSVIADNTSRLLNAANAMASHGIDYNDPLQVGYDDNYKSHVIDFSNAGRVEYKVALRANIERTADYMKEFGAPKQAEQVLRSFGVMNYVNILSASKPDDVARRAKTQMDKGNKTAEYVASMGPKVSGYDAKHAYYATNPRPVERAGILQSEYIDGVRMIVSDKPIDADTIRMYNLMPVVHPPQKDNTSPTGNTEFDQISTQVANTVRNWLRYRLSSREGICGNTLWKRYTRSGYMKGVINAYWKSSPQKVGEHDERYRGRMEEFIANFQREGLVTNSRVAVDQITGITGEMGAKLVKIIEQGVKKGSSPKTVANQLSKQLEISKQKAMAIARTEMIRLYAEGQLDTMQALGVDQVKANVEYHTAGQPCKKCSVLANKVFTVKSARGLIPRHTHCLPGNVRVLSRHPITASTKRLYDGDLVIITTAAGRVLTSTPNHPVLTDTGFRPAVSINKGDNVVCDGGIEWETLVSHNGNNVPTAIHDVTEAFRRQSQVFPCEVPLSAPDFHGDGANSQVAIVWTDSKLASRSDSFFDQNFVKPSLVTRGMRQSLLFGFGNRIPMLKCLRFASNGVVCGFNLFLSLLSRHMRPLQYLSLARGSNSNAGRDQPSSDGTSGDTVLVGNSLFGHTVSVVSNNGSRVKKGVFEPTDNAVFGTQNPDDNFDSYSKLSSQILSGAAGTVFTDKVVSVRIEKFNGHVYNLETVSGFYSANGIITHNCRCAWLPAVDKRATGKRSRVDNSEGEGSNCGIGVGGFQKGNTCAKGGKGGRQRKSKENLIKKQDKEEESEGTGKVTMQQFREHMDSLKGSTSEHNHIIDFIDKHVVNNGKEPAHGMTKDEPSHELTIDGIRLRWPADIRGRAAAATTMYHLSKAEHPQRLMAATKEIIHTGQKNSKDEYWKETYGMSEFRAIATGGDGRIVVYSMQPLSTSTFAHESGHNLATQLWGSVTPSSVSRYGRAQEMEPPVTKYGANSHAEDFAEACMMYANSAGRQELKQGWPKKYEALKEIMGE